jgi:tRNA(Met) C34 N-acetyltransferase TmcA
MVRAMDHVEALAALFADVGVTPQDLRRLLGTDVERVLDDATDGRGAETIARAIELAGVEKPSR